MEGSRIRTIDRTWSDMQNTVIIDLRADEWVVFEPAGSEIGEFPQLMDAVGVALANVGTSGVEDGSVTFAYDFAP
jgi:hypothetical protein